MRKHLQCKRDLLKSVCTILSLYRVTTRKRLSWPHKVPFQTPLMTFGGWSLSRNHLLLSCLPSKEKEERSRSIRRFSLFYHYRQSLTRCFYSLSNLCLLPPLPQIVCFYVGYVSPVLAKDRHGSVWTVWNISACSETISWLYSEGIQDGRH